MRLADLPCLADLVFVGNPLEEKHSAEGNWMDEASKRLPNLKKLDGKSISAAVCKNGYCLFYIPTAIVIPCQYRHCSI